jgi:hypothetical protein
VHRHDACEGKILLVLVVLFLVFVPAISDAQIRVSDDPASGAVPLRRDGNGLSSLRAPVTVAFEATPAGEALRSVASQARLDITMDPNLRGLEVKISLRARARPAAEVLMDIAGRAGVRIVLLNGGQLVVGAPPAPSPVPSVAVGRDSVPTLDRVALLAPVRTRAVPIERLRFEQVPNVASVSLGGTALHAAPRFLSEGDVLRTVQTLPGVQARNDYSTGFNVRGGEADQNLILLDGYPIYNPFHLGGLFGTFIDPAVGRIEMLTGGFGARYGGRLSSVLDVQSLEETRPGIHGTAEASLISSTLSLGGGLSGGNGSWLIAARRTYADRLFNLYRKNLFPYHFRDAQAHLTRTLPGGIRLAITGYEGVDRLDGDPSVYEGDYWVSWGNTVLGMTLSKTFRTGQRWLGDSVTVEQRISQSRFDSRVDLSQAFVLHSGVNDRRVGGMMTVFTPRHAVGIGYELMSQYLAYSSTYPVPFIPVDSLGQRTRSASLFVEDLWRPMPDLLVQAGARVDALDAPRHTMLLPRISAKYFLDDNLAITAAVGEYAQWVRSLSREDVPLRPLDFWVLSNDRTPVSRAWHYVAGVEQWLNPRRLLRVEGFYKQYHQLLESNPRDDAMMRGDELLPVAGSSYGVDVLLRQFEGRRFTGWMAYTYGVSSRRDADGRRYFPAQDRRHELNLVGSWRVRSYTFGARMHAASGTPYTEVFGEWRRRQYDPAEQVWRSGDGLNTQYLVGERNGGRLPLAHRLDLSVSRTGRLFGASFSPYVSVMNVYSAPNVFAYSFNFAKSPPTRIGLPQPPIAPTFGVSIVW